LIHDPDLLDRLGALPTEFFRGIVFRATRLRLDPLAPSTSGGRWAPRDHCPVLYTSLERAGALAEIAFHWGRLTPLPSKPVLINRIKVSTERSLHLKRCDLEALGVDADSYTAIEYDRCQKIGAAIGFLGCDGLIVPSARWHCENLVIFHENHSLTNDLELIDCEEVAWQSWARTHGLLDDQVASEPFEAT
jgi:hypothetical protein